MKIMQRGAEAVLCLEKRDSKRVVVKERVRKGYRISQIDREIRLGRTRHEVRLLEKSRRAGVNSPGVLETGDFTIVMDYIDGERVKDILNTLPERKMEKVCALIGESAARLHEAGIVHGDLTTSNMILSKGRLFIIDFGLGMASNRVEDMAVDMFLLREALRSAHFPVFEQAWKNIIKVYKQEYSKSNEILARFEKINMRRRYKQGRQ